MLKVQKKNTIIKHLMMLHFQNNVIFLILTNMLSFDEKLIEAKKEDVKIRHPKNETIANKFHCCIC